MNQQVTFTLTFKFIISLSLTVFAYAAQATPDLTRQTFIQQLNSDQCATPPSQLYIDTSAPEYDFATALSLSWVSLTTLNENFISDAELSNKWGIKNIRYIENDEHDMTIMLARYQDATLVTFRHTNSNKNWLYNADYGLWNFDASFTLGEKTHHGFARMLSAEWEQLIEEVTMRQATTKRLIVFGHSLGAALAQLSAAGFQEEGLYVDRVYLTGSPKVGSDAWTRKAQALLGDRVHRLVYNNDLIANLPIHYEALDEFREIFSIVPDFIANAFGSVRGLMKFDSLGQRVELSGNGALYWSQSDNVPLEEQYWKDLSHDLENAKTSSWNPITQVQRMADHVAERLENHLLRSEDGYFCAMIAQLHAE